MTVVNYGSPLCIDFGHPVTIIYITYIIHLSPFYYPLTLCFMIVHSTEWSVIAWCNWLPSRSLKLLKSKLNVDFFIFFHRKTSAEPLFTWCLSATPSFSPRLRSCTTTATSTSARATSSPTSTFSAASSPSSASSSCSCGFTTRARSDSILYWKNIYSVLFISILWNLMVFWHLWY